MAERRESWSKDYNTGYQRGFHEIEVPDRQPHEPMSVRAQARETSTKSWITEVVHGPHEQKDETGSYYRTLSSTQFQGTLSQVKALAKRSATASYRDLMKGRK